MELSKKVQIINTIVVVLLATNLVTLGYVLNLKSSQPTTNLPTPYQEQTAKKHLVSQPHKTETKQPIPDELLKTDPLNLFWNDLDQFEKLQKQIERQFQSMLTPDLKENFKINLIPKQGSYFHIVNEININWQKLYYEINVENQKISGKAIFPDIKKLQSLQQKINELGFQTKLKDNILYFQGQNYNKQTLNQLLEIFNLEIKFNKSPTPLNQEIFF